MEHAASELNPSTSFEEIIARFRVWAESDLLVRAAIVMGSQARTDHPADRWSDLDLAVYTTDAHSLISDSEWLEQFGEIWVKARDETARGDPEWYTFYAGGFKVDIVLIDIAELPGETLADWVGHPDFSDIFSRGVRVICDKTTSAGSIPRIPTPNNFRAIDQTAFDENTSAFFLAAIRAARLLHRQDLWRARQACDEDMKIHLLRMIEYHALSSMPADQDIWYGGRFIHEWADPDVLLRLRACFGGFDLSSLWVAFRNTYSLYVDLGLATAARVQLAFPDDLAGKIMGWIYDDENAV